MTTHEKARELVKELIKDGIPVASFRVDGKAITVELAQKDAPQQIDRVDWT